MVGGAEEKGGKRKGGDVQSGGGGNSRMAGNITVEVRERKMPTAPLAPERQLPHAGQSPANPSAASVLDLFLFLTITTTRSRLKECFRNSTNVMP